MLQRRGDKVPAQASLLVVETTTSPLLEGIYRTRLKQQPPAEWKTWAGRTHAKLRDGVIKFWSQRCAAAQLGQERASSIKDYLVDKGNWKMTGCTSSTPSSARPRAMGGW
jgi:phage gp37-like protein